MAKSHDDAQLENGPRSSGDGGRAEAGAPALQPGQAVLPPGHNCRVDDLAYDSVGEWYRAHQGRVPVQAAAGLSHYVQQHGCSFADAFRTLTEPGGPIVLVSGPGAPPTRRGATAVWWNGWDPRQS
ncbi:MAG: hypothetical protein ACREOA_02995 [Candidatus Dormibacteria bacterium]